MSSLIDKGSHFKFFSASESLVFKTIFAALLTLYNIILDKKKRQFSNPLEQPYTLEGGNVFDWHTPGFHLQTHIAQNNKRHHRNVLLSSFHFNGHTLGFHPPTQTLEPPNDAQLNTPQETVMITRGRERGEYMD